MRNQPSRRRRRSATPSSRLGRWIFGTASSDSVVDAHPDRARPRPPATRSPLAPATRSSTPSNALARPLGILAGAIDAPAAPPGCCGSRRAAGCRSARGSSPRWSPSSAEPELRKRAPAILSGLIGRDARPARRRAPACRRTSRCSARAAAWRCAWATPRPRGTAWCRAPARPAGRSRSRSCVCSGIVHSTRSSARHAQRLADRLRRRVEVGGGCASRPWDRRRPSAVNCTTAGASRPLVDQVRERRALVQAAGQQRPLQPAPDLGRRTSTAAPAGGRATGGLA